MSIRYCVRAEQRTEAAAAAVNKPVNIHHRTATLIHHLRLSLISTQTIRSLPDVIAAFHEIRDRVYRLHVMLLAKAWFSSDAMHAT